MPGPRDQPGQRSQPDLSSSGDPVQVPTADRQATDPSGPDRAQVADRQQADPPARWSRAELNQRLQRLPRGLPSSTQVDIPDSDSEAPPAADGTQHAVDAPDAHELRTQDAGPPPGGPDRRPEQPERNFWTERSEFDRAWAAHEARWPAEQKTAAVDRSRDPADSWRGDGGQYLTPDQHHEAKDVIAGVRRTEEVLTKQLKQAKAENTSGGRLEGLEFARKGEDRLKEKAAEILKRVPDRTVEDAIRTIPDAIRYTFCFESDNYSTGYYDIKDRLQEQGHKMVYSWNYWRDSREYKGINTRWDTPDGQRFEVQFHTPESFCAKQEITHLAYERLRNPLTSADERRELRAFQRSVAKWVPVPDGAAAIPDYPPKGPR